MDYVIRVGDTVRSVSSFSGLTFGKEYIVQWIDTNNDGLIWVDIGWRKRGGYLASRFVKEKDMERKIQVGDRVKVARITEDSTKTWRNSWVDSMRSKIGNNKVYTVSEVDPSDGVYLEDADNMGYDPASLDLVKAALSKANVKTDTKISEGSIKETNPKDAIADKKIPLWLCSPIAKAAWAVAQYVGMVKYGAWNWRVAGIRSSVYLSAMQRHIDAYTSGEEVDPVDQTPHLGHIMACAAILIDAKAAGKLNDDRPPVVGLRDAYKAAEEQMQIALKNYGHMKPKHMTKDDA